MVTAQSETNMSETAPLRQTVVTAPLRQTVVTAPLRQTVVTAPLQTVVTAPLRQTVVTAQSETNMSETAPVTMTQFLKHLLKTNFKDEIAKHMLNGEANPVCVLNSSDEGVEKCNIKTLERFRVFVDEAFEEFGKQLPRATSWREAFKDLDNDMKLKMTNLKDRCQI